MKWLFTSFLMLILGLVGLAQQRPQFTQFMLNKYYENAAYGGMDRSLSVNLIYRDQYTVLEGNPKSFFVGGHLPMYIWNGAVGFSLMNQRAGILNHSNFKASYNYVMNTPYGFFSLGGRIGLDYLSADGGRIVTPDGNYDDAFTHNDPILDESAFTGSGISYELATYFYGSQIEAGLTIGELPDHSFALGSARFNKTFFANAFFQYKYSLDRNTELVSGILIKTDKAVLQSDIFAMYRIKEGVFGGVTLRGYSATSFDAVGIIIGTKINDNYTVSYSYDAGISRLKNANEGSHELLISYNLNKLIGIGLPPKIIHNPRHL